MLSKLMLFHSRKLIWKCRLWNGNHFVLGLNMLTQYIYSWTELHWYTSSDFYPVSVMHVQLQYYPYLSDNSLELSTCYAFLAEPLVWHYEPGGRFKNTYELLNLRALKFSYVNKIHIFQCMGKIFCVEFQRYPLKFHTKYLTHTLKDMIFMQFWNFKSS